ncbi:putative bifunctional diguanylate cyclase/phosphodiesterase [Anaerosinus massiliensis]|uniref:putative bifunctional diguanylate cyclase/phosphodiesterase n=1 Tax=Massilibacillus massiliensis TaxID=1806837 RepID=UPI000DA63FFA|nr:bifunctional diguanylate cyclase/phosphodiesterase [Massilibacillus massiliensis]
MLNINFKKSFLTNYTFSNLPLLLISTYFICCIAIITLPRINLPFLSLPEAMVTLYQIFILLALTTSFIYLPIKLLTKKLNLLQENCKDSTNALRLANLKLNASSAKYSNEIARYKAEESHYQKEVAFLSSHDPLTKLPNRKLFTHKLKAYLQTDSAKDKLTAVIFIDLVGFKMINSTLGHDFADHLLIRVAECLKEQIQDSDHLCRLNGDDFIIVLPNIQSLDMITNKVTKMIGLIQKSWTINDKTFKLNANAGIAICPDDAKDTNTLIKMAEIAMQRAREQDVGRYQYYMNEMELNIAKRLEIENDLQIALLHDQFELYYQPQVDVNGIIVGVEALIRWNHPRKGRISPADFIPIAEDCGAIIPIGKWVIKTACKHNKCWQDMGLPPISVSINLSAKQFQQEDLKDLIFECLAESQLNPEWLTVEITETAAMNDANYTMQVLQDLKNKGIKISLDDFGMGYSSFIYLKRFPVDMLKIDRSFISDIGDNSDGAHIAKAILGLGKNLKLEVVAEGVETIDQLKFLRNENCSHIQGYLFGKPVPYEEITARFKTQAIYRFQHILKTAKHFV